MKSRFYVHLAVLSLAALFSGSATAAPPVSTWMTPAPGDVVSAQTELHVITDVPATSVEFFAGGVSLGVVSVPSNPSVGTDWRLYLEPTAFPNGPLQLSASATNADGTSAGESGTWVTIDNPDTLGPAIATVSPAAETMVTGTFTLELTATDEAGLTASYSLDGTTFVGMQALGNGAFTADIDSTPLTSGPFTFYVRARDADGNASVMPRTLTVANPTAPQPAGTITPTGDPAATPVVETPVVEAPIVAAPVAETPVVIRPAVDTVVDRRGSSDRTVVTGAGDDRITTGSGDDVIRAGAGNDVIRPGRGRDTVYAGAGNDIVHAQHGRSVIECGPGRDVFYANRFTVTRGCETVLVSSNNRFVKVKVGANGRPVMPRKR